MTPCPTELELVRFVDDALVPEDQTRVDAHLAGCSSCHEHVRVLQVLVRDLRAVPPANVSIDAHRADVIARISTKRPRKSRALAWFSMASSAAAGLVLAWFVASDGPESRLQARGSALVRSLSRDVAVQLYVQERGLRAVTPGEHLAKTARFTVGLRNLGSAEAYVMVVLIDSAQTLHWVTPEYQSATLDPSSTPLPSAQLERTLPTSVAFDSLAPGPLRAVSLISPRPLQVSALEQLPSSDLSSLALTRHFPDVEVRELQLDIVQAP